MPIFGFDRLPSLQASNARLTLSRNWIPFIFFAVSLLFINESPIRSLIFPAPLCNVSWGLSVCSVLVGSVSPCRLVLEVRLFPSPPVLFCPLARRWCPLFFFLLPFSVYPASAGCVCVASQQMQSFYSCREPMGTWMAWANEDPSKLLCKRTCKFIFRSRWHGAKPRAPPNRMLWESVPDGSLQ